MPQPDQRPKRAGAPLIRADSVPSTLRWAVWLLAAQAAGMLALLVFLIAEDLTASGPSLRGGLLVTGYALVMVIVLAGLSWALMHRRRWARGPAIVLEMLLLPIGYYLAAGGVPVLGLPIMAVGLAGAATLLAPATRAALGLQ